MKFLRVSLIAVLLSVFVLPAAETHAAATATPTNSTVLVDGKSKTFDSYNIDGFNYFKLRDIAYVMNGTAKQFAIDWNSTINTMTLTPGAAYVATGDEMTSKGKGTKPATLSNQMVFMAGESAQIAIEAYNIDGYNYFKLRDLGMVLDIGVGWDGAKNTISILSTKGYTNTASAQPDIASASSEPSRGVFGVAMFNYYRYDGNYYGLSEQGIDVQNIEKCLYNNYYKIKGIDPGVSVAIYVNGVYWPLNYLFSDSVIYNGKPYLINLSIFSSPGSGFEADTSDSIGSSNSLRLYAVKNCAVTDEIAVLYEGMYHPAYQVLSRINMNGTIYDVDPMVGVDNISQSLQSLQYKGKAGPYDFYQSTDATEADSIFVKFGDNLLARADPRIVPPAGTALPQPYKGPDMVLGEIQYKNHGIYAYVGMNTDTRKVGQLLDTETVSNQSYEIYSMNDVDPSRSIIAQSGGFYEQYDYQFPDTITYNGATYQADYSRMNDGILGVEVIKSDAIGKAGAYTVYAIQRIDPSVAVIVEMSGSSANIATSGDITFYRVQ